MGMFDWYEPALPLKCPVCGKTLTEWQGKDGPCGLFVWSERTAAPTGQRVDDECAIPEARRDLLRLPERFVVYSHDCPSHTVEAFCRCVDGIWSDTTVQWPLPGAQEHAALALPTPDGVLRLGSGHWCYVDLDTRAGLHRFGAEVREIIIGRLLGGLTGLPSGTPAGTVEGVAVYWVLSLAEQHTTFYVAPHEAGTRLFLQREDGSTLGRLDLPHELVEQWVAVLAGSL